MAKKKTKAAVAPSGLAISRSSNKFTFSWKRGTTYSAQQVQVRYNSGSWVALSVSANATSTSYTVSLSNYNPNKTAKITSISFRVAGKVGTKWSSWASKTFSLSAPNKPFVGSTPDSTLSNVCVYDWNFDLSTEDAKAFTRLEWEAVLIENCDETDGSKVDWTGSTKGTSTSNESSTTITEDTSVIASGTHTRWFRARTRGIAGDSAYNYTKTVYAFPYKANIVEATADQTGSGFICKVDWSAQSTPSHPIENTTVQYGIAVPAAGMSAPNGISWSDANVSSDTEGNDSAVFAVDSILNDDECLFVRVNTNWGKNVTYGDASLIAKGALSEPNNVSVNINTGSITATNDSDVPDSFMAVIYRCEGESFTIGVIPHGSSSITVTTPSSGGKPVAFGVYTAVGSYTQTTRADGVSSYAVDAKMRSSEVWQGGSVPVAPAHVYLSQTAVTGTISVAWDWTWTSANKAILSWADHDDAWESTDGPEEYTVNNPHASQWNIGGLATGKRWYVKVRLDNETEEATTEGPWSELVSIDLSSAPAIPSLAVSKGVATVGSPITLYWSFVSTDGTGQAYAEICADSTSNIIAHTTTAQQLTLDPYEQGWAAGQTHSLRLRVTSESNKMSDWSDAVYVTIAPAITASITSTSLENATSAQAELLGADKVLEELPLEVSFTGAGANGKSAITVKRAVDYHMARPDESEFEGYEGESIAVMNYDGNGTITITRDDLIGSFDDGAKYTLMLTVKDDYGQTDSTSIDFGVAWTHQAVVPSGTVVIDYDNLIAKITPVSASGITQTDTCDIYRLSADKPELIVKGGSFGTMYVDPYPSIGGGYRFVCVTANGDYITANDMPAWYDVDSEFEYDHTIIDFDGEQVRLYYNIDLSNNWEKDFQATRYLGGSVKGDWNAGIVRTATVASLALTEYDQDTINGMRLLAEHAGICHIRTLDGSSFKADLQVSDDMDHDNYRTRVSWSISCTRVDPETLDGITYAEWSA